MPRFSTTRQVRHSATAMLDLVADVERYPEFVPFCEELKILRSSTGEDGREVRLARMTIGYKVLRESFTSRVSIDRARRRIVVEYVDGPFRHLENIWRFEGDEPDRSSVHFEIDYSFRSRTFEILAGAVFDRMFRRMAEAFEERADSLREQGGGG